MVPKGEINNIPKEQKLTKNTSIIPAPEVKSVFVVSAYMANEQVTATQRKPAIRTETGSYSKQKEATKMVSQKVKIPRSKKFQGNFLEVQIKQVRIITVKSASTTHKT